MIILNALFGEECDTHTSLCMHPAHQGERILFHNRCLRVYILEHNLAHNGEPSDLGDEIG